MQLGSKTRTFIFRFAKDGITWEKAIEMPEGYIYAPMAYSYAPIPAPGNIILKTWHNLVGVDETFWYDPMFLVDVTLENVKP